MRVFSLVLLVALPLGAATAQDSRSGGAATKPSATRECFIRDLGELLVFDSTHLAVTEEQPFEMRGPGAGEGEATSQVFLLAGRPKLILMKYYGPWSRVRERYFLGDSADFVVERDEVYFDEPLRNRQGPLPPIVSHVPSTYYFCGGKLFQGGNPAIARTLIITRTRVLKEIQNAPGRPRSH